MVTGLLGCADPGHSPTSLSQACPEGASLDEPSQTCFCPKGFMGDPDVGCTAHEDLCGEASERVGHTVCAHSIDDVAQWTRMSVGGGPVAGVRRLGKFLVPVDETSRLPPLFSDANSYRLHYCLMSAGFEPLFPGLTTADHARLLLSKARREFYAGAVYELETETPPHFGFSVETAIRPEEMLSASTIHEVYRQLADRFEPGDLGYLPRGTLQVESAAAWSDPLFTVLSEDDSQVGFEAYTPGLAYGRIRLNPDAEPGDFSWQDIVVFGQVPVAWEGVMAAAVTGERQDILSHLNVLSAQRGTPNFFVANALEVFSQFEGQLVRVETTGNRYEMFSVSEAEAETFWAEQRPTATVENPAEYDYAELDAFSEIATETLEQRNAARSRFGAKTVGLATLSRFIDARYQSPGFGVPFRYYNAFMNDNAWDVDVGGNRERLTYAETVDAWLADEVFRSNASVRMERLESLRDEMRANGTVSSELTELARWRIETEFGDPRVMVRVRSSSNAEDTPTFNGAGLYDSTSACAADRPGAEEAEASACDPNKPQRSLERAFAKVWASLWSFGAYEEREYFGLDHSQIAMGATVSMRFEGENANGVAFTGSPVSPSDLRYTINAQLGEVDVVSPTPGVTAELTLLTIGDGEVSDIRRAVASSLVPADQVVMSDTDLHELGGMMARLQETFPVDAMAEDGVRPILDLEFKITSDGSLVIKQIRTFMPSPYSADPTCR
ncbi:MAG: PEP/pyruvate-binding domain-containing protein [Nannocystaceae bacterium]|nr:PEP/pyruvate-binding domain-containing protein [Nannocystaceae bacterium]